MPFTLWMHWYHTGSMQCRPSCPAIIGEFSVAAAAAAAAANAICSKWQLTKVTLFDRSD